MKMMHFKWSGGQPGKEIHIEYLQTETDDKSSDQLPMGKDELEDIIGVSVLEYILAQHSLTRGINHYGEKGEHETKRS